MHTTTIDVLIVGAGPTGATLAIDLARRGQTVRIIDRSPSPFAGSRAKGLQPRTLEVFEDLGVLRDIQQNGSEYPRLGIHLGPLTIPWRMMRREAPSPATPYPNTWLLPQFQTDRILHERLAELGVAVEQSKRLVAHTQDEHGVLATVQSDDGQETIAARFLVGADGGASQVRRDSGIAFEGETDEADRIIILDAALAAGHLSRDRWHIWPGWGGRFAGACPLPQSDLFQWMFRLAPGEAAELTPAALNDRLRRSTRSAALRLGQIQWRSVFRPNIRLAARYRSGRVFLAGDAAHVHTPAGAQGLNTGVQDAYNLGWKLGQVLAGAPAALLDSYEAERRPIAASVLGLSTRKYRAISSLDPSSIRRGRDEQQLAISYHGGPLAHSTGRRGSLRAGDRAPDAVLVDAQGKRSRLFSRLTGPHFTVLATGPRAASMLDRLDEPSQGAALHRVTCSLEVHASYSAHGDALFLIRPDGYIGAIGSLDRIQSAVASMAPGPC